MVFTGSTETAWAINRTLAARDAPIAALIAETGGQNAMIADSSALPEQLVKDVIASAFDSAGQRCSAARVLFIQEDIADKVIEMLAGAMDELKVGDPGLLSTDVGPVIDEDAKAILVEHAERMDNEAKLIAKAPLDPSATEHGTFFAPRAYEIPSLSTLKREIFGPVLHVMRCKGSDLDNVVDEINATGYGLTLGIHSRIDATVALHQPARQRRQLLRQPQPDRRRGRRAAVRRRRPFRHRAEGGRAALSAAVYRGADADDQYDGGGGQCFVVDDRRIRSWRR